MLGRSIACFAVIGCAQQAAAEILDGVYLRGSLTAPNLSALSFAEQPAPSSRPGTKFPLLYLDPAAAAPGSVGTARSAVKPSGETATANWSGVYFGPHIGGATGNSNFLDPSGFFGTSFTPATGPSGGLVAGGQVGFNLQ